MILVHLTRVHFFLLVRELFQVPGVVHTVYGQGPHPVEDAACMARMHTAKKQAHIGQSMLSWMEMSKYRPFLSWHALCAATASCTFISYRRVAGPIPGISITLHGATEPVVDVY